MTNENPYAAFRGAKADDVRFTSAIEELTQEYKRTSDARRRISTNTRWAVIFSGLLALAALVAAALISSSAFRISLSLVATTFSGIVTFEVVRTTRRFDSKTKRMGLHANSLILIGNVAMAEEAARVLANERLGARAETASLKVIFEYLLESRIWDAKDVEAYRNVLQLRNSLVHEGTTGGVDDSHISLMVTESKRLLDKLALSLRERMNKS